MASIGLKDSGSGLLIHFCQWIHLATSISTMHLKGSNGAGGVELCEAEELVEVERLRDLFTG